MKKTLIGLFLLAALAAAGYFAFSYLYVATAPLSTLDEIQKMLDSEDYARAIRACKKRLLDAPRDYGARVLLGNAYEESSEPDKAEKIYRRLVDDRPREPFMHLFYGRSLYHQGKIDAAIAALRTAKALVPSIAARQDARAAELATLELLSEIYLEHTKEYDKAIAELEAYLALDPKNVARRFDLGTAYDYAEKYASAYREFERIAKENPNTDTAKAAENAMQFVRERRNPRKASTLID